MASCEPERIRARKRMGSSLRCTGSTMVPQARAMRACELGIVNNGGCRSVRKRGSCVELIGLLRGVGDGEDAHHERVEVGSVLGGGATRPESTTGSRRPERGTKTGGRRGRAPGSIPCGT